MRIDITKTITTLISSVFKFMWFQLEALIILTILINISLNASFKHPQGTDDLILKLITTLGISVIATAISFVYKSEYNISITGSILNYIYLYIIKPNIIYKDDIKPIKEVKLPLLEISNTLVDTQPIGNYHWMEKEN